MRDFMISSRKRFEVFKRDNYSCQICGNTAGQGLRLEVDHKLATSNGGEDELANLWTLCFNCNRGKANLYLINPKPADMVVKKPVSLPKRRPLPVPGQSRVTAHLYNNIPLLLKIHGKNIRQFSKEAGLSYTTAFDLYHSKSDGISLSVWTRICDYFQVTPGEIFIYIP
jgi:DNA-binding Xre family transcriptional regulator